MSEPRLDPPEQQVERTLARLSPVGPGRTTAASVLLEAERRRQRLQLWSWRAVAAVLALALAIQFSLKRFTAAPGRAPQVNPIGIVTAPGPARLTPFSLPLTGDDYISTRNRMIAFDARPALAPVPESHPPKIPAPQLNQPSRSFLELLFTNTESVQS